MQLFAAPFDAEKLKSNKGYVDISGSDPAIMFDGFIVKYNTDLLYLIYSLTDQ